MKYYRCLIHGEHFPGVLADEEGVVGFHTAICINTDEVSKVERLAIERFRKHPSLQLPSGVSAPQARVKVEEYFQIEADEYTDDFLEIIFYTEE